MESFSTSKLFAPVLAAVVLGGCYMPPRNERDSVRASSTRPTTAPVTTGSTTVRIDGSARLTGTMGAVQRFDANAEVRLTSRTGTSIVQLDAENTSQRWWAMTRLTITGGLGHATMRPGAVFDFNPRQRPTPGALAVSVLGCSGPRRGNFTFDGTADRVVMQVDEGPSPGTLQVFFTAYWTRGGTTQQVEGSFEYDPQ